MKICLIPIVFCLAVNLCFCQNTNKEEIVFNDVYGFPYKKTILEKEGISSSYCSLKGQQFIINNTDYGFRDKIIKIVTENIIDNFNPASISREVDLTYSPLLAIAFDRLYSERPYLLYFHVFFNY